MYRCHQLPEPKFIQNLKQFSITKRNIKNHFIIGDFNIDISALNTISLEHLNNLLEAGYCPGFTGITRPSASSNSGSCIDNIFFKTNSIKTKSFELTNNITDHYSIFISISKIRCTNIKEQPPCINPIKLRSIAIKTDWKNILSMHDPNLATETLIHNITTCIDQSYETKKEKKR